jgi:hypothetical protein
MDLRFRFVRELIKTEDADTRLFVFTWRGSFSASQALLDDFSRYTDAILIGEPASSKPNSYGDSFKITLPNSGLTARVSILWHQIDDGDAPWTPIDVSTPLTLADYAAGRDPALDAALHYVPTPPLEQQLVAAVRRGGSAAMRATLTSYLGDDSHRYADVERQLLSASEHLVDEEKRNDDALYLAQFATQRFPRSDDAWSVLAYVGDRIGRADVARAAATRALDLQPNNRFARSLLDRLGVSTN